MAFAVYGFRTRYVDHLTLPIGVDQQAVVLIPPKVIQFAVVLLAQQFTDDLF